MRVVASDKKLNNSTFKLVDNNSKIVVDNLTLSEMLSYLEQYKNEMWAVRSFNFLKFVCTTPLGKLVNRE